MNEDGNEIEEIEFTISDGSKGKDSEGKEIVLKSIIKLENLNGNGITINDVVNAINSAKAKNYVEDGKNEDGTTKWKEVDVPLNIRASYDHSIGRFFIQTTKTGNDAKLQIDAVKNSNGLKFVDALQLQKKMQIIPTVNT